MTGSGNSHPSLHLFRLHLPPEAMCHACLPCPQVGAGWAQLSWRVCSALHHHDKLQALSLLQQLHWRMLDFWLPVADVGKIRKEAARQAAINCSYVHRSAVLLTQSLALLPLAQPAGAPLLRCQAVGPMLPAEGSWPSCCMSYQVGVRQAALNTNEELQLLGPQKLQTAHCMCSQ